LCSSGSAGTAGTKVDKKCLLDLLELRFRNANEAF